MFSSKAQLRKRTPDNGTDRKNFLSLLVDEYLNSKSYDAKCQVLANLANFSYDPVNYAFIRDVGVLDILLYVVKNEKDHKLLHFAAAGICNLCVDPLNAEYIVTQAGLQPLKALLNCEQSDIVADTITSLLYLYNEVTKSEICTPQVVQAMKELQTSEDKRLTNLATIFLQDTCSTN